MFGGNLNSRERALRFINCIKECAEVDGINLDAYESFGRGKWSVYVDGEELVDNLSTIGAAYVMGTLWRYKRQERQQK